MLMKNLFPSDDLIFKKKNYNHAIFFSEKQSNRVKIRAAINEEKMEEEDNMEEEEKKKRISRLNILYKSKRKEIQPKRLRLPKKLCKKIKVLQFHDGLF